MNVLFLNNYHYMRGGSERVYFGDMAMVEANGHRVAPFARRTSGDRESPYARFFPEDLQTDRVTVSLKGLRTVGEVIHSGAVAKCLEQLLAEFQPDVAHAHNIYGRLTTSVLRVLKRRDIPVVMTLHDYKLICPSYNMQCRGSVCEACQGRHFYHAVVRRCLKGSQAASAVYAVESYFNRFLGRYRKGVDLLVSPSGFLRDKLIEYGWDAGRIEVVANCLDLDGFTPAYMPGDHLLYLGRLSEEKGVGLLLDAFSSISGDVELVVAGTGPLDEELRVRAAGDPRVRFVGYMQGDALEDLVRQSRAVVIPSTWYENAPMSILEAMAYGKPVIGARIGGIPEMVEDGVTGILFSPGDRDGLTNRLKAFFAMREREVDEMGRAARRRVEAEYGAEDHYERLMAVYERAMGR